LVIIGRLSTFDFATDSNVGIVKVILIRRRNVTLFGSALTSFGGIGLRNLDSFLGRGDLNCIPSGSAVG
jgi:hypothetical protein